MSGRAVAWPLLSLILFACDGGEAEPFEWPEVAPGAPVAGAAEGVLDLPVGTPLGGYSSRCGYLGSTSTQDKRDSPYTRNWAESTGIQTRPGLKVVWLENGGDHLVWMKADTIYAYDNLIVEVTRRLEEQTGESLDGRVILTTNHSHASYANYADMAHFYLGGDYYNEEIFQRFADQLVDLAMEAWDTREPVAIGAGWAKDWDPNDAVYRDRRGDNDDLVVWEDAEPGYGKDPYVHMFRLDRLDGSPLAAIFTFGIHGITLSEENPMVSLDSPGHLELMFQEEFDEEVVVMHVQGAGGDASPAGWGDGYPRMEVVGTNAAGPLYDLWASIPTSDGEIAMEAASRHIPQTLNEIHVTRNGEVDWYYPEPDPTYVPDDVIYAEDGSILSPLDEFNAPYGAAFCGSDSPLIPAGGIAATVFPYSTCMDVELVSRVLLGVFQLEEWEIALPMNESQKSGTTAARLGPIQTLTHEGEIVERDQLIGFFPAEVTGMFAEQWRRRTLDELGYEMSLIVGYAQDHEGYFLIPEDWLSGGYEPNINIWGPLQGEHVMEGVLEYVDSILGTDVYEDDDPLGWWAPTEYADRDLSTEQPDLTTDAGTRLEQADVPDYFWLPLEGTRDLEDGVEGSVDLEIPAQVERVTGEVQLAWRGGDPMVDSPKVVLEREEGGSWVEVTSRSGRPITEAFQDILLAWTPDPLYPSDADQTHYWWATWQAVGHVHDRAGVPEGTYRLKVTGQRYSGGAETWPWPSEPYELTSDSFEVVPTSIQLAAADGGLEAWIQGPEDGWRLVHVNGDPQGDNPIGGDVTVVWGLSDGSESAETAAAEASGERSWLSVSAPADAVSVTVTDAYGNTGTLDL